ncbi:cadmium resistance transporter [Calothrix sp. PCC 7507]|uniref:cadmium resistance transporter n=1 Tax=Calothrix sp. PCC 7507 TaxID=99598 RepID=UPI00029F4C7B|nr:cadmium resistance transporter [Calothrix sp. PCC 7507]AFY31822.1 cadmium resistance transporter [Calothrix sp. PCC 7507]
MSGLVTAISTGITAFSATNIDDMFILALFFSQVNETFRRWHIIIGQYLGFTVLVILSIPGFFGGLIIPKPWIGLFGLVPIVIGIRSLLKQEEDELEEVETEVKDSQHSFLAKFLNLQTYSVAAVTFANGTDNISIYFPLFASSSWESLLVILAVFFLLVGCLCYVAYKLTHNRAIADILTRYGNTLMPFVLMGLGAFILLESGTLTLLNLLNREFLPFF